MMHYKVACSIASRITNPRAMLRWILNPTLLPKYGISGTATIARRNPALTAADAAHA